MIKQLLMHTSGGLGVQPPASPWSERSEGTDVRRSAEGAGEGRSPKRSEGLWACKNSLTFVPQSLTPVCSWLRNEHGPN